MINWTPALRIAITALSYFLRLLILAADNNDRFAEQQHQYTASRTPVVEGVYIHCANHLSFPILIIEGILKYAFIFTVGDNEQTWSIA